jgi:fibronectin-binding autotransporter adhesin
MRASGVIGAWAIALGLLISLLWVMGTGLMPAARAAEINDVDTTEDELDGDGDCSLREAIQAANTDTAVDNCTAGSGADTVNLGPGTFVLSLAGINENGNQTGDLDILGALTIIGAGPEQTIIDAGGIDRALDVDSDAGTVVISGVTILNGDSSFNGGGIEASSAGLTLVNVVIRECSASVYGGGLSASYASTVLSETQIFSNSAQRGGGVYVYGGDLVMEGGEIVSNTVTAYGGGIYLGNSAEVTVNGAEIVSNTANYGGGLSVADGSLALNGGWIRGNEANNGGGVDVRSGGSATLAGAEIAGNVAVWDGGGVHVHSGWAMLTAGQIIDNGADDGAGVYVSLDSAVFTQTGTSTIAHNTADGRGGGIMVSSGSAWLLGGTVYSNTALGTENLPGGGGLYVRYGNTELDGGQILENAACCGAGVYVMDPGAVFTQTGGLVAGNVADSEGGGVYLRSGVAVLEGGAVRDNTADLGGGIYTYQGRAVLVGGQVLSNTATTGGGGVLVYHTTAWLEMSSGQIAGNTAGAGGGGGVHVESGSVMMEGGMITGNNAGGSGGGASVGSWTAVMTQTGGLIELNDASRSGGGVYIHQGHATLSGGIVDNDAQDGGGVYVNVGSVAMDQAHVLYNGSKAGGGIYNSEGTATIVNSTISHNTAAYDGGGLYNELGTMAITYTTIADNSALHGQGIMYDFEAPVVLNTILANGALNCNQALASGGYNLEDADTCGLNASGDITGTNPMLGGLVADGDAVVRPLLEGSPAIDHGTCIPGITADQRGVTRPQSDGCDIGAYEFAYRRVYLPLILR